MPDTDTTTDPTQTNPEMPMPADVDPAAHPAEEHETQDPAPLPGSPA